MASLEELRKKCDETLKFALSNATVSCKSGCSACCQQLLYCSLAEGVDLVAAHRDLVAPRRQELRRLSVMVLQPEATRRAFWGNKCVFLSDEGKCGVYERRPFACRTQWVTSPADLCADPDGVITKIDMRGIHAYFSANALDSIAGVPKVTGPLVLMLYLALLRHDEPDELARFVEWMGLGRSAFTQPEFRLSIGLPNGAA